MFKHIKINLIALQTLVVYEITRFMRIWMQSLLPSVISAVLYFLIFGSLIGSRLGNIFENVNFTQFIAPGLIVMAIITNAYSNVVFSVYTSRFQRSIEEILVSPTPNWVILLGYITGGLLRSLTVGILVTLVALFVPL